MLSEQHAEFYKICSKALLYVVEVLRTIGFE
jgi:hypothetical protein